MSRLSAPRLLPLLILTMVLLILAKGAMLAEDAGAAIGLGLRASQAATLSSAHARAEPDAVVTAPMVLPVAQELSANEKTLLQDLRRRRQSLDERERAINERNGLLEAAELRLQRKIDDLTQLQSRLEQADKARNERKDADWIGLVKVYQDMKPRDAAAIFDVLDMRVLLEVLDRMNDRKAAAILAAMQPERARIATQMLAQRRVRQDTTDTAALLQK